MSLSRWLTGGLSGGDATTLARLDAELTELYFALAPHLAEGELTLLAIGSADTGEGRSHLASHVAEAIAERLPERILLVDADTRRPGLHRYYDAAPEPGLAELLRGEERLAGLVRPTLRANLGLLPAGAGLTDELLDRAATQQLLKAADGYRVMVCDTGPLLDCTAAVTLAQAASGVLLVVQAGRTQGELVARAQRMLHRAGATLLGVVVNDPRGEFSRDER